jgi:hypothetical protein
MEENTWCVRGVTMKEAFIKWLKAAGIRTIKTMAEVAVTLIGTNTIGVTDVDWLGVGSAVLLSGIVTILTCIKGLPELKN